MDTLIFKFKSILGNTVANICNQGKFVRFCPIKERREAGQSQIDFTDDVGLHETLLTDGSGELTCRNTEFVKHASHMHMQL